MSDDLKRSIQDRKNDIVKLQGVLDTLKQIASSRWLETDLHAYLSEAGRSVGYAIVCLEAQTRMEEASGDDD